MKIRTIRTRILTIFILSGACISLTFFISYYYFSKNEHDLWDLNRKIDLSNHYLLRDIKVIHDFFSNETINSDYYQTGKSVYLNERSLISSNFVHLIREIKQKQEKSKLGLGGKINRLSTEYQQYSRNIDSIIKTINLRGFKDYGLEGRMRYYAHQLEQAGDKIGKEQVLLLRKHEKDFILRQDDIYKQKLHIQASELKHLIRQKKNFSPKTKDLYVNYIDSYESKFDSLVYFDNLIGLKKQDGLKKKIDMQADTIDKILGTIHLSSFDKSFESLSHLKQLLILILILLAIGGIILTFWISDRISRSVIFLKEKIREFIDSDFSTKISLPVKQSKYEVDILAYQFTILQEHIENQMTTLKYKNHELEHTYNELTHRFNDMLQFNYIVSHNFRAPVANLIGLSELIITGDKSEDEKLQMTRFIQTSVLKIDAALKDLSLMLSFRSTVNIEKEAILIPELIDNIADTLQIQSEMSDMTFNVDIPDGADKINTAKTYLESVLYNLLSNALKYRSPSRKLAVSIQVRKTDKESIITLKDNGIGIDLDKNGKDLFGLYKRFHLMVEGKGLGLYMCKTQIETMGGTIKVESEIGVGTTFIIKLPAN
jgi:signal transduction histidine kinase